MENIKPTANHHVLQQQKFWSGKRVFMTGHTGFKGAWLALWLHKLGAQVTGFALEPPTRPSLYELCGLHRFVHSIEGDVRDQQRLREAVLAAAPDIVLHMAAQPLVRASYQYPLDTYATNVMGTVHLLEAVRQANLQGGCIRAVVNITTDKCYENKEWPWGYREPEALGGHDPYSSSKACSELVTAAYRSSFFPPQRYSEHGVAIATARAGNVIGGGDWARDRLIPDSIQALIDGREIVIRHPNAIRPWQHVLEPLSGYLLLAQRLYESGPDYAQAWNFGPAEADAQTVEWMVRHICALWSSSARFCVVPDAAQLHEANFLKLDCSKAKLQLGWKPRWRLETALSQTAAWYKAYQSQEDLLSVCLKQINQYQQTCTS